MPRQTNLAAMSIDALLQLRNDVGDALSRKADALKSELQSIGADYGGARRTTVSGRKSTAGRKIAPKYRGPNGDTWAGRGAQPVWMTEAIKKGAKREDFLIDKSAQTAAKKSAPKKKAAKKRRAKK
jgi:DNA-binding protein H-NS